MSYASAQSSSGSVNYGEPAKPWYENPVIWIVALVAFGLLVFLNHGKK